MSRVEAKADRSARRGGAIILFALVVWATTVLAALGAVMIVALAVLKWAWTYLFL